LTKTMAVSATSSSFTREFPWVARDYSVQFNQPSQNSRSVPATTPMRREVLSQEGQHGAWHYLNTLYMYTETSDQSVSIKYWNVYVINTRTRMNCYQEWNDVLLISCSNTLNASARCPRWRHTSDSGIVGLEWNVDRLTRVG